jgi:hypothetical protein
VRSHCRRFEVRNCNTSLLFCSHTYTHIPNTNPSSPTSEAVTHPNRLSRPVPFLSQRGLLTLHGSRRALLACCALRCAGGLPHPIGSLPSSRLSRSRANPKVYCRHTQPRLPHAHLLATILRPCTCHSSLRRRDVKHRMLLEATRVCGLLSANPICAFVIIREIVQRHLFLARTHALTH